MKPEEFWNSEYRECVRFCNMNYLREKENIKNKILIYEALTDKIIQADAMSNKHPKILSLKKIFKKLIDA